MLFQDIKQAPESKSPRKLKLKSDNDNIIPVNLWKSAISTHLDMGSKYLVTGCNISGKDNMLADLNINREYQITKIEENEARFIGEIESVGIVKDNSVGLILVGIEGEKFVDTKLLDELDESLSANEYLDLIERGTVEIKYCASNINKIAYKMWSDNDNNGSPLRHCIERSFIIAI